MGASVVVVSAWTVALIVPSPPVGAATSQTRIYRDITYKAVEGAAPLRLDVYAPSDGSTHPAILLVHGGGWSRGDKSEWVAEGLQLAGAGFVAFAADYSLSPPGGTAHATTPVTDLQDAVSWIRANASSYGVDPARVGALGDSAGGNLVMMLGTTGAVGGTRVEAVVSWSGPSDLPTSPSAAAKNYVGCTLSACRSSWVAASPITFVDSSAAPMYIANSQNEKATPVAQATEMADALAGAGVPYELNILSGSRHARAYESDVWADSIGFLSQYLGVASERRQWPGAPGTKGGVVSTENPNRPAPQVSPTWTTATGGRVLSSPTLDNGTLYVGSEDGSVYALDAGTGAIRWTASIGAPVDSTPAVAGGIVYVGAQDGNVHALDAADGALLWSTDLGTLIDASPTVANGLVYVGGLDATLYALDAVATSTDVYAGSNSGSLYAFDAATGLTRWVKSGKLFYWCPQVSGTVVYVGVVSTLEAGTVEAYNANTGKRLWVTATTNIDPTCPSVSGGVAYVGSADGQVYAINASTGATQWHTATGDQIYSSPAVSGGVVYAGSDDHNLWALEASTGGVLWTASTGGEVISSPTIGTGLVYVGSADGNIYAFPA
jgi:outer membrane protein assembly factor BamB